MPSSSPRQARTMAAAAHNPGFARKVGIPQNVARDFNDADAGTGIIKPPRKPSPVAHAKKRAAFLKGQR